MVICSFTIAGIGLLSDITSSGCNESCDIVKEVLLYTDFIGNPTGCMSKKMTLFIVETTTQFCLHT